MASGGCDHSLYAWTVLPLVLSARRFDDIEKMLHIQNGLSKNGLASSVCIENLVMLLFYREPAWENLFSCLLRRSFKNAARWRKRRR